MDCEVVNLTKIKDGFFLGDEATASNLDIIIQFKITHMINSAGQQIMNSWESIGIKYLTLNWSETPSQNLFDQKYEIVNRIVSFIDDSSRNGEGILVHSVKGQNRGCIVVIIYCMKKYRWSLVKAIEFLSSKKFDVEIPKYFLNQLTILESWMSKMGVGPISSKWESNETYSNENELDEAVLSNTYINGLPPRNEFNIKKPGIISSSITKKLKWTDNGMDCRRDLLTSCNLSKDLLNLKEIKPVTSHKNNKNPKSILKGGSNQDHINVKASSSVLNELKRPLTASRQNLNELVPERKSSFNSGTNASSQISNNIPLAQQRPSSVEHSQHQSSIKSNYNVMMNDQSQNFLSNNFSSERKGSERLDRQDNRSERGKTDSGTETPKISIINNNINNFYIQSPNSGGEFDYKKDTFSNRDSSNNFNQAQYPTNKFINNFINPTNSTNLNSSNNFNSSNNQHSSNNHPMGVNIGQHPLNKTMNYNYVNHFNDNNTANPNPFKAIHGLSYTPNHNKSASNGSTPNVKNMYLNPVNTTKKPSYSTNPTSAPVNPISNPNNLNILPKTNVKAGPVKLSHSDKKSEQLINNLSTIKYKSGPMSSSATQNFGLTTNNNLGTIKRSNSKQKEKESDRPSTAPSKYEKERDSSTRNTNTYSNNSQKRLPSPNIKSSSMSGNKPPVITSNYGKRQPSPQLRSFGLSSSFKPSSSNKYNLR